MPRWNRHCGAGYVWHLTHRCHEYEVQESSAAYKGILGYESADLRLDNTNFWDDSL